MALTCGEETSNRVNGVDYLLKNHRELIDAAFALNEGAGGLLSADGKPLTLEVQAGEKIHQVFSLEVTNPGGHSSRPVPDNAIYRLAVATQKIARAVVSRPGQSGRARVLPRHRADARRRDRRGDERGREESRRPGGARNA